MHELTKHTNALSKLLHFTDLKHSSFFFWLGSWNSHSSRSHTKQRTNYLKLFELLAVRVVVVVADKIVTVVHNFNKIICLLCMRLLCVGCENKIFSIHLINKSNAEC